VNQPLIFQGVYTIFPERKPGDGWYFQESYRSHSQLRCRGWSVVLKCGMQTDRTGGITPILIYIINGRNKNGYAWGYFPLGYFTPLITGFLGPHLLWRTLPSQDDRLHGIGDDLRRLEWFDYLNGWSEFFWWCCLAFKRWQKFEGGPWILFFFTVGVHQELTCCFLPRSKKTTTHLTCCFWDWDSVCFIFFWGGKQRGQCLSSSNFLILSPAGSSIFLHLSILGPQSYCWWKKSGDHHLACIKPL